MVEKSLKFYLKLLVFQLIYYFTVGMIFGWFATEAEIPTAIFGVALFSYIIMLLATFFITKSTFGDYTLEKGDILKLLIPYLVILGIFLVLLIVNLSGFYSQFEYSITKDNSIGDILFDFLRPDLQYILTFLLPSGYSAYLIFGLFDFSYLAYYIPIFVFSGIHILFIALVLSTMKKRMEQS